MTLVVDTASETTNVISQYAIYANVNVVDTSMATVVAVARQSRGGYAHGTVDQWDFDVALS